MTKLPEIVRYRGALYTRVAEPQYYSYADVSARGTVEAGNAFDPEGGWHPGWADRGGWKYAELDGRYLRVDTLQDEGWRWEWDEGNSQETVDTYPGYGQLTVE